MKITSKVCPQITIEALNDDFNFILNGVKLDISHIATALNLSRLKRELLQAEAFDLVWPLDAGLVAVTVIHDKGFYRTDVNAQVGRKGVIDYFLGNTVYLNLGIKEHGEDGTPCKVTGLEIQTGNVKYIAKI